MNRAGLVFADFIRYEKNFIGGCMRHFFSIRFVCLVCFIFAVTGCLSSKKQFDSILQEASEKKLLVASFPEQRPDWCDSIPASDANLYFIGVSNYFSTETEARGDARTNAMNQIVKFYGTVIKSQSNETKSVKALSSDVIDPYLEREELIQSFAQRYVSQVAAENYYVEQYSVESDKEQWLCYVKCSVPKEKVQKEIESFAADISERYAALLPEKQPGKYVSTGAAAEAYLSVCKAVRENPMYQSVAYFNAESGKTALDEYAISQAKRIMQNCAVAETKYEVTIEKGEPFLGTVKIKSPDYEKVSGIKAKVSLVSKGKVSGTAFYGLNADNSVDIIIHTVSLDYGTYTVEVQLLSDVKGFDADIVCTGSAVMMFEVVPVYAGIEFVYSGMAEKNAHIEQKFTDAMQGAIRKNEIPIFIDGSKKESRWKFIIHLDGASLASHESVSKSKISGNIQIQKNGVTQVKSADFSGIGLSKMKDASMLDAAESCYKQLDKDSIFYSELKSKMEETK